MPIINMRHDQQLREAIRESAFVKAVQEGTLVMDNSEFVTWGSCDTMGLYYGGLKRVPTRSRSALTFGAAIHAGLESYFRMDPKEHRPQERAEAGIKAGLAWAVTEALDDMGDPKRNERRVEELLAAYFLQYDLTPSQQFNILFHEKTKMVEQSFTVPLGNIKFQTKNFGYVTLNIIWSGKLDLLTKYLNAIAVVDHKTTTVMGEKFMDDKERSSQFPGYVYAARYLSRSLFGDMPVFGARINALALRTAGFEFKQFDLPIADWKVAEWQEETLEKVQRLVLSVDEFLISKVSLPTREHCVTKYGKCPYFDVCSSHETMRSRLLFDPSYYYISDWSPLE